MEQLATQNYNPHLKRVLEKYQTAAERSLSGPAGYPSLPVAVNTGTPRSNAGVSAWEQAKATVDMDEYRKIFRNTLKNMQQTDTKMGDVGPYFNAAPFLIQPMPLLLPTDSSRGEKSETVLEGVHIACFIVGGEKRLCLPQILNTVLRDFTLQDINAVCDELHIFCSRCNREQLEILKRSQILPKGAASCGLITKTDAERLCNALLHRCPEKATDPPSRISFKVYHECFGKCKGLFSPELYTNPNSKCIQCCDCRGVFSPQRFVCHSHKALENRTCHWGFDSANWRAYLLLAKDQEFRERYQPALDDLKAKFDSAGRYKRKESPGADREGTEGKKIRYDGSAAAWVDAPHLRQVSQSAFRPWSPSLLSILKEGKLPFARDATGIPRALPSYLQTGPPVLVNPDRVVSSTDSPSTERHFAPNVSLAPESYQKLKGQQDSSPVHSSSVHSSVQQPVQSIKIEPICHRAVSPAPAAAAAAAPSFTRPNGAATCPDLELSSSSDSDSIKTESLPCSPRHEGRVPAPMASPPTPAQPGPLSTAASMDPAGEMEAELSLLQRALDGHVGESSEARGRLLEDYRHLQQRRHDRLCQLRRTNDQLHQELQYERSSKAARLRELVEANQGLKTELQQLRAETSDVEMRLDEVTSQRDRLQLRLEEVKSPAASCTLKQLKDGDDINKVEVDALRATLRQQERAVDGMKAELQALRQCVQKDNGDATDSVTKSVSDLDTEESTALLSPVSRENSLDCSSATSKSDGPSSDPCSPTGELYTKVANSAGPPAVRVGDS